MKKYFLAKIGSIKNLIVELYLNVSVGFSKKLGVSSKQREPRVVISLTSYPKRFHVVLLTIESLMRQDVKPDKIVLWLAEEEVFSNKIFMKKLEKFVSRGLEVYLLNENIKSYKKLFYSLQKYPKDIIVTCDDDTYYPSDFLKRLYTTYLKNKNCICAYRCSYMQKECDNKMKPYISWRLVQENDNSENIFPTGVGGVLYPPGSLHPDVLNKPLFMQLAPTADDVWFKAMALKAKTKTVMVDKKFTEFPTFFGSQKEALWKTNVNLSKNDIQIKQVFDYFDLYPLIK